MPATIVAPDPVARALSWITTRGIETRPWTAFDSQTNLDPPDHPILYLVEPGVAPPRCGELEDWIRHPLEVGELTARTDRLVARSQFVGAHYTRVDDDGVLRVGDEMVVLSRFEARLMRVLIDAMGTLVLREVLTSTVWPDGLPADPRALDNRIKTLRARLEGLPLRIHTVRGRGFLLERVAEPEG